MPVRHDRAESLALRWIIDSARGKKGKPMTEKLFEELKNAKEGTGTAIKKRDDTHRMAEANRAFAHFSRF
jgi:small subunit ribosomal protein S7